MFKKFIPPLLAEKDMAAATATVATRSALKAPLPQASQLPKSAPYRPDPATTATVATNCHSSRLSQLSQGKPGRIHTGSPDHEDLRPPPPQRRSTADAHEHDAAR